MRGQRKIKMLIQDIPLMSEKEYKKKRKRVRDLENESDDYNKENYGKMQK